MAETGSLALIPRMPERSRPIRVAGGDPRAAPSCTAGALQWPRSRGMAWFRSSGPFFDGLPDTGRLPVSGRVSGPCLDCCRKRLRDRTFGILVHQRSGAATTDWQTVAKHSVAIAGSPWRLGALERPFARWRVERTGFPRRPAYSAVRNLARIGTIGTLPENDTHARAAGIAAVNLDPLSRLRE